MLHLGCLLCAVAPGAIVLRTTGRVPKTSVATLTAFLATPSSWPQIVASSSSVEGVNADKPLRKGLSVTEVFGLPPVLPLRVEWTCASVDVRGGSLDVRSPVGLTGVAIDCRMAFTVSQEEDSAATVELAMSYEPQSALGRIVVPVLWVDNWLALNVLLPFALASPLDRFRRLMGGLYGSAGIGHFLDCVVGPSTLLTQAGLQPFAALGPAAQAAALGWCAVGPAAFILSLRGGKAADAGLVAYGFLEVGCAVLVEAAGGGHAVLAPAAAVQAVIAASWIYSRSTAVEA
ncbi:hypothetical protein T492DRAFT_996017 [Pavlovales sp. CCMP2436]|nr:hypothetical protein T492DRAFT_996017 [Pavlovales sp. CCMP2436]|mmetsp:Transcript_44577/g.110502  ORF Transcript_44577/g.110502 Transcript_44577/m.110502 type:complete len:289 (+) Transcript_44577:63-929(+)